MKEGKNQLVKVKYSTIAITSVFIIGFEYIRHQFLIYQLPKNFEIVFSSFVYLTMIILYSHFLFHYIAVLESRRQQEEREAKNLFDNSIDGIFIFDSDLNLVEMNHGAEVMSGCRKGDAVDIKTFPTLFRFSSKEEIAPQSFERSIDQNFNIKEGYLIRKDGYSLPISMTFSRIPNPVREHIKFAAIVRDLTEQKEMEQVIKGLYQEATQKQFEAEIQYRIAKQVVFLRNFENEGHRDILQSIVQDMSKLCHEFQLGLFLFDFNQGKYWLAACSNPQLSNELNRQFKIWQKESSTSVRINWEDHIQEKRDGITWIPLQGDDGILGFVCCFKQKPFTCSLHQLELLKSIVHILSISFENVRLYQRTKDIAVIKERGRLAREMHDGLAQNISFIHMQIQVLKVLLDNQATCTHDVKLLIQKIDQMSEDSYQEVRQNLFDLRIPLNSQISLIEYLYEYVKHFELLHHLKINLQLEIPGHPKTLNMSEQIKIHVIRIIQEALSNVYKHAHAKHVRIILQARDGECHCIIEDDGIGFQSDSTAQQFHYGIQTMTERASLFHGSLKIDSRPQHGTRVILKIPLGGKSYGGYSHLSMR